MISEKLGGEQLWTGRANSQLDLTGIGLLTATALVAATSGDVSHFKDARHFSSWFPQLWVRKAISANS